MVLNEQIKSGPPLNERHNSGPDSFSQAIKDASQWAFGIEPIIPADEFVSLLKEIGHVDLKEVSGLIWDTIQKWETPVRSAFAALLKKIYELERELEEERTSEKCRICRDFLGPADQKHKPFCWRCRDNIAIAGYELQPVQEASE